ncbi:MAG: MiaB/RimO family radical SAM methylthiotransferase [Candidatus Omnitrophota bacterium]
MKTVNLSAFRKLTASLKVNGKRSKTIKFYTLGCKVNQYETQQMREKFIRLGFRELENGLPASVYVINSCTVTQRADSESLNFIRRAKRENRGAQIIVTGCLTELDGSKIRKVYPNSLIVKNRDKEKLLGEKRGISSFRGRTRAFLKIQDGCNNHCAYCKVPLARGPSRSRPLEEIVCEAKRLAGNGFKEIVLTGICLGSYGKDFKNELTICAVIEELEKIDGISRIRLSSIEAAQITDGLIDKLAVSNKLCPHLHIPIQSGDDQILKKMNRRYTSANYLSLVSKIRSKIPLIAITTDVLVGFPGETEENFQNTVKLLREITPLKTHIFPYSEREGTPAQEKYKQPLSPLLLKKRSSFLAETAGKLSIMYKKQFLGRKLNVLVEGRLKAAPSFWVGYTDNYIRVLIRSGLDLSNRLIQVELRTIMKDDVTSRIAKT